MHDEISGDLRGRAVRIRLGGKRANLVREGVVLVDRGAQLRVEYPTEVSPTRTYYTSTIVSRENVEVLD